MKLRTVKLILSVLGLLAGSTACAQAVLENPLEWAALVEGNEVINKQISSEIKGQTETAALQNTMAAEFKKIHEWEKKYSNYIQAVSGYASSLKAATYIYDDALRAFLTLGKLKKAVEDNPQGIAATVAMNTLYLETATELVSVFTLLRNAVAKGGKENMLTGAERSETLWNLNDKLDAFNKKLHRLYISIHYYTMVDVWNSYTVGMIERRPGTIARQAHDRWKRAARVVSSP